MSLLNDALKATAKRDEAVAKMKQAKGIPPLTEKSRWRRVLAVSSFLLLLVMITALIYFRNHHLTSAATSRVDAKTLLASNNKPTEAVSVPATDATRRAQETLTSARALLATKEPTAPPEVKPTATEQTTLKTTVKAEAEAEPTPARITATSPTTSGVPATAPASFEKTIISTSGTERLLLDYQNALRSIDSGETETAMTLLGQSGMLKATQGDSALTLAHLLWHRDEPISAEIVLKHALEKYPESTSMLSLLAHVEFAQKKYQATLDTLSRNAPTLKTHPAYYSLMARTYIALKEPEQAIELYEQIITKYPATAKWWVGLALALQSNQERAAAIEAYQKAVAIGELSPDTILFAKKQIRLLSE